LFQEDFDYGSQNDKKPSILLRLIIPGITAFVFIVTNICIKHWNNWRSESLCYVLQAIVPCNLIALPLLYFSYEYWFALTGSALCFGLVVTHFL